jgi:uncharacterized membrane protein (UPF0127 family)
MVLNRKLLKYWHQYWHLSLLLLITFVIAALYLSFNLSFSRSVSVQAGSCNFITDLADTTNKQYQGLSDRKQLAAYEGMLFIFNEVKDKTFVMRNMNFPLDIIFIRDHKIINLYHNLKPEGSEPEFTYHSGAPVDAVLEITAGQSRHCHLGVGTEVSW